jgi:site-specific recombinase XerD
MAVKTDKAIRATGTTAARPADTRNAIATSGKHTVGVSSGGTVYNNHTATPARMSSVLRLPLQALIDEFLYEVDETLAAGSYRAYSVPLSLFLRHLRKALGREPLLADLNIEAVRAWSQMLREQPKQLRGGRAEGDTPIALSSRRNYLRHLRAFANWLTKPPHYYLDDSPLRHYKLPRGEETAKIPIEPDALRKLLRRAEQEGDSVCGSRGRALLLTLVDAGLRAREIISLTIGDVSLKEGILVVRRSKGRKPRLVAIGGETVRALRRYALLRDSLDGADGSPQAPFFQTIHGTAFTYYGLRSWLRRLERDTGVSHVYLHLLRHTSAIETLDAGADVRTVQLKLGHADIRTTQGYLNMAAEKVGQLQRAFSPVDRLGFASDARSRSSARSRRNANEPKLWHREPTKDR